MTSLKPILFGICLLFSSRVYAVCVQVEKADLHYGPSTKHQKTWEVYRHMPFQKLSTQSGWMRVKDVDGDIHWIPSKLVTSKYKCAVVKVKTANLRTGPGTKYATVPWGPAQKYYAFKIIEEKGKWFRVEDAAGGKAWIHGDLIWTQ